MLCGAIIQKGGSDMWIGEAVQRSGLSKKAIYHYMKEQLIRPIQKENDYYDFSEHDIQKLKIVRKMRYLGFSIDVIRSTLENPSLSFYYFIKQKKALQREAERLTLEIYDISKILESLNTESDIDTLTAELTSNVRDYPDDSESCVIDENDAELLAYYFWGRFVGKLSMTEYQKFLWEKMKRVIVQTQTSATRQLRDALYSFQKSNVSSEFLNPSLTETQIYEIAALTVEGYSAYTDCLIQNAWKHLGDSSWIQYWKENQTYLMNAGIFFDSEASKLMRELSPVFAQYQKNINQLGELLGARLRAEERPLLDAIRSTLSPAGDLYANHHAVLIGICI